MSIIDVYRPVANRVRGAWSHGHVVNSAFSGVG
jgi:hypothetical protein